MPDVWRVITTGTGETAGQVPVSDGAGSFTWMDIAPGGSGTGVTVVAPPPPPSNVSLPVITITSGGSASTFGCSTGAWANTPTSYTYQWKRDGSPINGATSSSYLVTTGDQGHTLSCTVTAGNAGGSASATAAGIAIQVPLPTNTGAPTLSGTATVGQVLTCRNGTWTNNPTSFTYQWLRDGSAIGGQTNSSYTVVTGDAGHTLACTVTASNAGGSASATTAGMSVGTSGGTGPPPTPGAPTGVGASAGNAQATVTWTDPTVGGPFSSFVITPFVGSTAQATTSASGTAVSAVVTGLTNGTTYTFKVHAVNSGGAGSDSSASNSVVPLAPSGGGGGGGGGGGTGVWAPPVHLRWNWVLQGTPSPTTPTSPGGMNATDFDPDNATASVVNAFHTAGQKCIAYIDVGTAENWRADYGSFPSGLKGSTNGWPGENWVDVRPSGPFYSTLQSIMAARMNNAKAMGFDAIEPDNMDGTTNSTGFSISSSDQLAYVTWIANYAHSIGLAVFQKNWSEALGESYNYTSTMVSLFDGGINEQGNEYGEMSYWTAYIAAGKPVLNAEYSSSVATKAATYDNGAGIMGALFSINLDGSTYKPFWTS